MKNGSGVVFDIKRYAIHDGPGIRTTVFFKGCPLRCAWCQNPESMEKEPEFFFRPQRCAPDCRECVRACPERALSKNGTGIHRDLSRCRLCGACAEACVYEALEMVGKEWTVEEVLAEIEKDRVFYEESGGGVTFSGGEPLLQPAFLARLLSELESRRIPAAVDTSGHAPPRVLEQATEKASLLLYDLKLMDEKAHEALTGVSNRLILENMKRLARKGRRIVVRVPLIHGVNDDDDNIMRMESFLRECPGLKEISLLPYHRGGEDKRKRLGGKSASKPFRVPREERLKEIQEELSSRGFSVKIGG